MQLCLHVRNVYGTALTENDWRFFDSWVSKGNDRPIYLWLYYTFPQENTRQGGWRCWPGWFAHTIDRAFKRYHRAGVRGAFFNGWGQDADAYVTLRLMDDPTLDIEPVLDEYFTGYYGAAAEPMKAFYLTVEKVYSDSTNYPKPPKGKILGHQTEEMAWRYLGTPERMKRLETLMVEARKRAATALEKRRVAFFEKAVWDYMRGGPVRVVAVEREDAPELPATLERRLYRKAVMASDDDAQGKPFVLETPGAYFAWKNKTTPGKGKEITAFTDGDTAESIFFHHAKPVAISARCDLGPVPAKGRELRSIRLCWSMADSQRSRVHVKFAVRDAASGEWRDITPYFTFNKWEKSSQESYEILTVPFAPGAVNGFDAVRLVDGTPLIKLNPTRFTEIDLVTAPAE